jgi:O-antigen/teichoic acid export membrane protein
MSSFRILSRNILSNWVAYAFQIAIAFVLTPLVLHELGNTRYGLWSVVISVTGYYGLLDLGLRAGMTQYITRYFAKSDFDRMNQAASSGFVMHAICAAIVMMATVVTAWVFPAAFSLASDLQTEARWCIVILGVSTAMQLVLFPMTVALTATQRFDLVTTVSLGCRLLSAAAIVASLHSGFGLLAVCLCGAVGNVLDYLIRGVLSKRVLPELRISMRLANWNSAKECLGFGFWSALLSVSHLVINLSDAMVIAFFMPVSAIAFFALANNLIRYFANAFVPVSQVFFPAATDLDARDDAAGLQKLYLTGSRMLALTTTSAAIVLSLWAGDFFSLWVGTQYVNGSTYTSVPVLFQILILGSLVTASQGIGSKVLLGRRRVRGLTWLMATEGSLNLLISVLLIQRLGLLGVAIGTTVPAILCRGIVQPVMVCSNLKLRFKDYRSEILQPTIAVSLVLVPLLGLFHRVTSHAGWTELFLEGFVAAVFSVLVLCTIGLKSSDRHRYLYPTIKRIIGFQPFFLRAKS